LDQHHPSLFSIHLRSSYIADPVMALPALHVAQQRSL
jgi:hypothetical protein